MDFDRIKVLGKKAAAISVAGLTAGAIAAGVSGNNVAGTVDDVVDTVQTPVQDMLGGDAGTVQAAVDDGDDTGKMLDGLSEDVSETETRYQKLGC